MLGLRVFAGQKSRILAQVRGHDARAQTWLWGAGALNTSANPQGATWLAGVRTHENVCTCPLTMRLLVKHNHAMSARFQSSSDQPSHRQVPRRAAITYTYNSPLSIVVKSTTIRRLAARIRIIRCSACCGLSTVNCGRMSRHDMMKVTKARKSRPTVATTVTRAALLQERGVRSCRACRYDTGGVLLEGVARASFICAHHAELEASFFKGSCCCAGAPGLCMLGCCELANTKPGPLSALLEALFRQAIFGI
jgi:hypothetical protein